MKKVLLAAAAVTMFATVSSVLASPSEEAAGDYEGWRAAQKAANPTPPAETRGHVIYRSNPVHR